MGLGIALALGLVMILAVGRSGEVSANQGLTPPPLPPEVGPTPDQLERKRVLVQRAFVAALQRRAKFLTANRVRETQAQSKNAIAAYFRSKGVILEAPRAEQPFWQMPEPQFAAMLSAVVNNYTPVAVGPTQINRGGNVSGPFPTYIG